MRLASALLSCFVPLAAAGCGADDQPRDAGTQPDAAMEVGAASLIHNALWEPVSEDNAGASPSADCVALGFGDEELGGELAFAIRTDYCPALTLEQPLRAQLASGDTVTLRLYHFPLSAPEPAAATLWIRVGDEEVFRAELSIPRDAALIEQSYTMLRGFAEGTPVQLHVDNHGQNEYALLALERS